MASTTAMVAMHHPSQIMEGTTAMGMRHPNEITEGTTATAHQSTSPTRDMTATPQTAMTHMAGAWLFVVGKGFAFFVQLLACGCAWPSVLRSSRDECVKRPVAKHASQRQQVSSNMCLAAVPLCLTAAYASCLCKPPLLSVLFCNCSHSHTRHSDQWFCTVCDTEKNYDLKPNATECGGCSRLVQVLQGCFAASATVRWTAPVTLRCCHLWQQVHSASH
jgi:hypothetical protein